MKTIILTVAILTSSLFNVIRATETVTMNELLEETITFNNNSLNLKKDQSEFVRISFKVDEERTIDILDMNYSNVKIKDQLVEKLKAIEINESIDIKETYYFNFTFEKK